MAFPHGWLSARKTAVIDSAATRLCGGLDALEAAASGANNGQIDTVQVLWFCKMLKRDARVCLAAAHSDGSDDDLEGMAR